MPDSTNEYMEQILALANALQDKIFIIDENGRYINIYGKDPLSLYDSNHYLKEKSLHELHPKSRADKFLSAIRKAIKTDSLVELEYRINRGDISGTSSGSLKKDQWYEGRLFPLKKHPKEARAVVWVARNITRNKRLKTTVKNLSETDIQTGIYNRRFFYRALQKEFDTAFRYKDHGLCLLMVGVDSFNQVNDILGHRAGDTVLKRVVDMCEPLLRTTDTFARYGSDVFTMLLPHTERSGALILSERIRQKIDNQQLKVGDKNIHLTVSIGVTGVAETDKSIEDAINRANLALYKAKKNGRNIVVESQ